MWKVFPCKMLGLTAQCCALQDIQFLLTLKRACAVEKLECFKFPVSLYKYSQFCVKTPG